MTFAGIQVSKTLYGRTMQASEFDFTIDSEDPDSIALLADTDKSFTNENNRAAGVARCNDEAYRPHLYLG